MECPLCFEDLVPASLPRGVNQKKVCVAKCGHVYHKSCLREWLKEDKSCPTCRADTNLSTLRDVFLSPNCVDKSPCKDCQKWKNDVKKLQTQLENVERKRIIDIMLDESWPREVVDELQKEMLKSYDPIGLLLFKELPCKDESVNDPASPGGIEIHQPANPADASNNQGSKENASSYWIYWLPLLAIPLLGVILLTRSRSAK